MTTTTPRPVRLIEPMPGFADDVDFTLSPIDDAGLLRSLRSVRDPGLRFVVTPAGAFFADYHDSVRQALAAPMAGLLGGEGASIEVYLVLTVGASLADTTANLRAPLVVELASGRALQVILDDEALPMRHPLTNR
jgi:flagellar assembly factor FliW